jgi:hypothetical protein
MVHFRSCIANNPDILGEELVSVLLGWAQSSNSTEPQGWATYESKKSRILYNELANCAFIPFFLFLLIRDGGAYRLLLSEVTRGAEHHNDGIFFELDGTET